jgi:hypothetical protein
MHRILMEKFNNWKPALMGFISLGIDITDVNMLVQVAVGLITFAYIAVKLYYLIKRKGKS